MAHPALTQAEKEKVSAWMSSGFERYIQLRLEGDAGPEGLTRRYAEEFGLLPDVDLPKLWGDLQELVEKGCPALDVVEFMLACTSGFHATLDDLLYTVGLTKRHLRELEEVCAWSADIIGILRRPFVAGPFLFLKELLPESVDVNAMRHEIEVLPDALTNFADLLKILLQPVDESWINAFGENCHFLFLFLLLQALRKGSANDQSIASRDALCKENSVSGARVLASLRP